MKVERYLFMSSFEFSDFCFPCIDWCSGVLPLDNVSVLMNFLEDLHQDLSSSNFDLLSRGYKNYNTCIQNYIHGSLLIGYNRQEQGVLYNRYNNLHPESAFESYSGIDKYPSIEIGLNRSVCGTTLVDCNNPYIYMSCSGEFLKFLRDIDKFYEFIEFLHSNNFKCSRLDISCDFIGNDSRCLVDPAIESLMNPFGFTGKPSFYGGLTRFRDGTPLVERYRWYTNIYPDCTNSFSISFGDHKSSSVGMIRLYDKFYEMTYIKHHDVSVTDNFWYRLEIECHKTRANLYFNGLANSHNIFNTFGLASSFYFRPTETVTSTYQNANVNSVWESFLTFCLSQNDYFVSFSASESSVTTQDHKVGYLLNQKKTFIQSIGLLINLLSKSDHDNIDLFYEYIHDAFDRCYYDNKFKLPLSDYESFSTDLLEFLSKYKIDYKPEFTFINEVL